MQNRSTFSLIAILAPFVFSFAFGLDIYIPVVPQMRVVFHTDQVHVQLTLSIFLFITGVGQLFMGPLSDQWGRQRILLLASFLFTFGNMGCAMSHHIEQLIVARVVSALGACGMLAVAFAIIRDLAQGNRSARLYSFLNSAIGISPLFAPIIGGYINYYFNWRGVFIFLVILGFLAFFITLFCIQETLPKSKRIRFNRDLLRRYLSILKHRQFLHSAIFAGFGNGVFFSFFSVSPFIIVKLLHVPVEHFGYYFAVFGSTVAMGGILSAKMIALIGIRRTLITGIVLLTIGGLSMLLFEYYFMLGIYRFLASSFIACIGAAFLIGPAASFAMEAFAHMAGTAAATLGCIQFFIAALLGSTLMHWPVTSSISYAIELLILSALASGNLLLMRHHL